MDSLVLGVISIDWKQIVMLLVGIALIALAIRKNYEPALLLPIGFGTILANIPFSAAIGEYGPLTVLFNAGISTELFPLLIFIAIGAMIDFTPLLTNPYMLLFGAAAQFGIFATITLATLFGFPIKEAAAIGIIGAADGPTSIYVANRFAQHLLGPISVAAYSYMALVPIIQPPVIRLLTTSQERKIRMDYNTGAVPKSV
ncbi:MAG: sodium ion-translocating decarboxylase subunit beta, partial [Candidatus Cloacimonetes bacterium]|nr:sodium ion-translocating decarboxylase subunit beta [Candidatus Cloacimonadota bacterium]